MSDINNRAFNEQAYLLYYWFYKQKGNLRRLQKSGDFGSKINGAKLKGSASVHRVVGNYNASNFMPKVLKKTKADLYRNFFDLETKKISALVPYVKLYKVLNKKNTPFYFPTAAERTDIYSMLQPGASLGGVGIQSFSMDFQGKDSFMRDKNIVCKLSIFLDSIEILFRDPPTGFAPLAELITISRNKYTPLKEGLSKQVSSEQVNRASSHEIAADIGYSIDDTSDLFDMEERRAIRNTNLFLRMTLTDHSIDVRPDGTAVINASYIGRASGVLQSSTFNSLLQSPDFLSLSSILSDQKEKIILQVNSEKKKKMQQNLQALIRTNTSARLRNLFAYLDGDLTKEEDLNSSRIHSLRVSSGDVQDYFELVNSAARSSGPGGAELSSSESKRSKPGEDAPVGSSDLDKKADVTSDLKKTAAVYQGITVNYVYLGDFVESFLFNARKNIVDAITLIEEDPVLHRNKKTEKIKLLADSLIDLQSFKVLFGEIAIPLSERSTTSVNLADVPVSLSLIQKYFFNRIQQEHTIKYTVNNFLDDLVAKIYPMLLKEHLYKDAQNLQVKSTVKSMVVTGESTPKLAHNNTNINIKSLPDFLKRRNSLRSSSDDIDFLFIYAEPSPDSSVGLEGKLPEDIKNGVYHIHLSKDRGLLKGISFSQVNQKYRKEALMLESVSLYDELKMPYNAQITMFGNNLFLPGSTIYINPSSIGFGDPRNRRSAAARLGLGGYYVVTSVSTTYSGGKLETSLNAIFNSWADSDKSMTPTSTMFADAGIYDRAIDKYGGKL